MLIDNLNVFSDSQAITATADSTKKVNLNPGKLVGKGEPLLIDVRVTEAFDNLTSLKAELHQSTTEGGTYTLVPGMSETIALAGLTKGATFKGLMHLSRGATGPWYKMIYTVTGTAPTKGKIFSAFVREIPDSYEATQYIDKGKTIA